MAKVYLIRTSKKDLSHASDMLRYDGAYKVQDIGGGWVEVEMTGFTPGRWRSFGVSPPTATILNISASEHHKREAMAGGFREGIRFTQSWLREFPDRTVVQA